MPSKKKRDLLKEDLLLFSHKTESSVVAFFQESDLKVISLEISNQLFSCSVQCSALFPGLYSLLGPGRSDSSHGYCVYICMCSTLKKLVLSSRVLETGKPEFSFPLYTCWAVQLRCIRRVQNRHICI